MQRQNFSYILAVNFNIAEHSTIFKYLFDFKEFFVKEKKIENIKSSYTKSSEFGGQHDTQHNNTQHCNIWLNITLRLTIRKMTLDIT